MQNKLLALLGGAVSMIYIASQKDAPAAPAPAPAVVEVVQADPRPVGLQEKARAVRAALDEPEPGPIRPEEKARAVTVPLVDEAPPRPAGEPQVLLGPAFGQKSAPEAIRAVSRLFHERTGMKPSFECGYVSDDGMEAEGVVRFTDGARRVKALIRADIRRDLTVLMVDSESTFVRNLAAMIEKGRRRAAEAFPEAQPWRLERRVLNDGSVVAVPAGWRVSGHQGMISAEGPEGALDYGCAAKVWSNSMRLPGGLGNGLLFADYTSPAQVYADLFPQIASLLQQQGYPAARLVRINDRAKVENPVGPAEVIDAEWDRAAGCQAVRWRTLALVITVPMADGLVYYISAVHAPAATFPRDLRNLLRMWDSAQVSAKTQAGRLDQAARSLREANRILTETNEERSRAFDRCHKAWDAYIRGEEAAVDRQTGAVSRGHTTGGYDMQRVLDTANQGAGYQRFKVLDPKTVD